MKRDAFKGVSVVGTVVTGDTQKAAVQNYLQTVTAGSDDKAVFTLKVGGKPHAFLTRASAIDRPFSPLSGRLSSVPLRSSAVAIAAAFGLRSAGEVVADSHQLFTCECSGCGSHIVGDNPNLVKHCIHCGAELDDTDEGEESVDLSIVDPEFSEEEDEEVEAGDDEEDEGEEEEDDDLEAGDDEEEEEEEEEEEDADEEIEASDDEEEASEEDEAELEDDSEACDTVEAGDDEEDDAEEEPEEEEEEDETGEEEMEDDEEEEDFDDSEAVASIEITEASALSVNLLDDALTASATIADTAVRFVYSPSETVAGSRWYAMVNNMPVAYATAESVGQDRAKLFNSDSFMQAANAVVAKLGVQAGLKELGFMGASIQLPVRQIVEARVSRAQAAANTKAQRGIDQVREEVRAGLSTASVGINKGFFRLTNPLKVALYESLSAAGIRNAEVIIDDAFAAASDEYHKVLLGKAFELLSKSVDVRDEIAQAVASASYQRVNTVQDSMSASVQHTLASGGLNPVSVVPSSVVGRSEMTASSGESFDADVKSVISGLGR